MGADERGNAEGEENQQFKRPSPTCSECHDEIEIKTQCGPSRLKETLFYLNIFGELSFIELYFLK